MVDVRGETMYIQKVVRRKEDEMKIRRMALRATLPKETYFTHVVVTVPSNPPQSMPSSWTPGSTRTMSPTEKSRVMLASLI